MLIKLKEIKMKLTEKQIIEILKNKTISKCTKDERMQVMNFAFGEDYMKQSLHKKGTLQTY
jgi:hypothetical protein